MCLNRIIEERVLEEDVEVYKLVEVENEVYKSLYGEIFDIPIEYFYTEISEVKEEKELLANDGTSYKCGFHVYVNWEDVNKSFNRWISYTYSYKIVAFLVKKGTKVIVGIEKGYFDDLEREVWVVPKMYMMPEDITIDTKTEEAKTQLELEILETIA